jgi:hypothetical protein
MSIKQEQYRFIDVDNTGDSVLAVLQHIKTGTNMEVVYQSYLPSAWDWFGGEAPQIEGVCPYRLAEDVTAYLKENGGKYL